MPGKCFVISPIGPDNSEIRRHADTVFDCIIKPACAEGEGSTTPLYIPERGDHKTAPGKITDQIYEDILGADLVITVLTGANPNVYYELAIAQSAAKPVILLMERGFEAPFDIKDQRIIYYDFDPQQIFRRTYVNQLRAAIQALASRRGRPRVSFAPNLAPLGDPMQAICQRASEAEDDTIHLVHQADSHVWICGYSLKGWLMNQDFVSALRERAGVLRKGIRVLLAGNDNPALKAAMKSEHVFESAIQAIVSAQASWAQLRKELGSASFEIRISQQKSIGYQMTLSEKEGIVVPYLTSRDTLRSPYIQARADSFYHEVMLEEFNFLWDSSVVLESR